MERFKIIKADERHRGDIDRLLRETKIAEGLKPGPIRNFWVAKIDGRVVGCAGLAFINKRVAVYTHLAVEKPLRHNGIGSALTVKRLEAAKKKGVKVIALITMYYHFNRYKRRGFRTIPRAELADDIKSYPDFTSKRYMKCAVMINENL